MKTKTFNITQSIKVALVGTLIALPGTSGAEEFSYAFGGQRITLTPKSGDLWVKSAATTQTGGRTLAATLGVSSDVVQAAPVAGWNKVTVSSANSSRSLAQVASASGVTALVTQVASQQNVSFVSSVFTTSTGGELTVCQEILLKYRSGVIATAAFQAFNNTSLVRQEALGSTGIYKVTTNLRTAMDVITLANTLAANANVEFAHPDFIQKEVTNLMPTDPLFSQAWGLHNSGQSSGLADFDMDAPEAWNVTVGSSGVIVVVMDDGVQTNHPDIYQTTGRDFTGTGGSGGPVTANDNHGTAVAGCISGKINNGMGAGGVAPGVRVASAKIYSPDANGRFYRMDSWVVSALDWARSIGAKVTNSSWGGGSPSSAIDSAFQTTRAAGILHMASAGNGGNGSISYPASSAYVEAVGAANRNGQKASFSQYGTGLEFLAPGESIITTDRTGSSGYSSTADYATVNGTSFASPYAAGVAALVFSRNPTWTPDQVLARMRSTCVDMGSTGYDTTNGYGLLNAAAAVGYVVPDDHGNTTSAATVVASTSSTNGNLEVGGDIDMFRISVSSSVQLTANSSSSIDTYGELLSSTGSLIQGDDDSNGGRDFRISRALTAGTYYIKVRGYSSTITGTYQLRLTATTLAPLASISGNGFTISDGDTSPSTTDGTQFGSATMSTGSVSKVFTIRNNGTSTLSLTGSTRVSISGTGASHFSVTVLPASSIAAGASTSFTVRFAPRSSGVLTATVSIANNDAPRSPYDFVVQGTCSAPADDHGNTTSTATSVSASSATAGNIQIAGDEDFFRFTLTATTNVTLRTTGSTDTYGYLLNSAGSTITSNDDYSSSDRNFRITTRLSAGTYFVRVRGYNSTSTTGTYSLLINR